MKLTDAVVRWVPPEGKDEVIYWDDAMPGFGIRLRRGVDGKITRRWIVQYKTSPRQSRRMTLGDPGRGKGLVWIGEARAKARELLAKAQLGDDPQGERLSARRAPHPVTFGQRASEYLDEVVSALRPRTRDAYRLHLMVHARPLHHRPIAEISRSEIAAWLSGLARERGMVAANRTRATGSAMFAWCIMQHELGSNPVVGTPVRDEVSRDRVLSETELVAIWHATDGDGDYGRIVRLLLLTAARRDEVGGMKWSEIDGDLFTLPAARSKNHTQHEIPLPPLTLQQLPARVGVRDAVFGRGGDGGGFSGWSRCKARLDAKSGVAGWVLHDLRRSAATWMAENGVEPSHIDAVLNHVSGVAKSGIRAIYNRATYVVPKRVALGKWADHIASITGESIAGNIASPKAA